VTSQSTIPNPPDPGLKPLVEQAKDDLAHRLSVPVDQIEVLEAKAVVWPDASLGCPLPGQAYAQVLTPGYRVILETGGQAFEYHLGPTQPPVLCGEDGLPALPLIPIDPDNVLDGKPWIPTDD
jgi:hypothetical protein